MCEIPHVPAVIPNEFGTAATGFDGSTIGIDVIPGGAIHIIEVCRKERNANKIKLSVRIINRLRNLILMDVVAVIV